MKNTKIMHMTLYNFMFFFLNLEHSSLIIIDEKQYKIFKLNLFRFQIIIIKKKYESNLFISE